MRAALKLSAYLVLLATMVFALVTVGGHLSARRDLPPLPSAADIMGLSGGGLPVRVSFLNTASQRMARSAVLDPRRDPRAGGVHMMSHPAIAVEWADGRVLLIDTGMVPADALAFGRRLELISDADPIVVHGSPSYLMAEDAWRVRALLFTHLHEDHVGAAQDLCGSGAREVRAFMTRAQAERPTLLTRAGLQTVKESSCARLELLADQPLLKPVPGFDGVWVFQSGGHTPGSQLVVVKVLGGDRVRTYVAAGDAVNNHDGIRHDVSKPLLYRTLAVPEFEGRLGQVRALLAGVEREGAVILVAHDQNWLERTVLPWSRRFDN